MGLQRKGINKMSDADAFRNLLLHLRPEAEEETGSAGEQPASNRLPRYAERACGADSCQLRFFSSDCAPWLRKPYVGAGLSSQGLRQHRFCGPDWRWTTSGVFMPMLRCGRRVL